MVKLLFKSKRFLFGFLFISILLATSFMNTIFNDGNIREMDAIYELANLLIQLLSNLRLSFPWGQMQVEMICFMSLLRGQNIRSGYPSALHYCKLSLERSSEPFSAGISQKPLKPQRIFLARFRHSHHLDFLLYPDQCFDDAN
jgi:hypothetical protein